MNNVLKQIVSIPGLIKNPEDANSANALVAMMEQYSEKYVVSGVSQQGVVTAKMSISMTVKAIKIDREKLASVQSEIFSQEAKQSIANEVLAELLEEEVLSALQNARAKIITSSQKGIKTLTQITEQNK